MWRNELLVFRYEGERPSLSGIDEALDAKGLVRLAADEDTIKAYFKHDAPRSKAFTRHLRRGYTGWILCRADEWVTYAWMSRPFHPGPAHLPRWVGSLGGYWIHYCRTREGFRGEGFYKLALRLLVSQACASTPSPQVFIDTDPDNAPARRAIRAIGFHPNGVLVCQSLKLPRLYSYTWGRWHRRQRHPET